MLPTTPIHPIGHLFNLPEELVTDHFFIRITDTQDFIAFSGTCKLFYAISRSIPVITLTHLSNREFLLQYALRFDQRLHEVTDNYAKWAVSLEKAKGVAHAELAAPTGETADELFTAIDTYAELTVRAKEATEKFFFVFKTSCHQLHVHFESIEFLACVAFVQELEIPHDTVLKRIYEDIIETFSNQPPETITTDSFKQIADHLEKIYRQGNRNIGRVLLRQRLKSKHEKSFKKLAFQLLDSASQSGSPKVVEVKKQLTPRLISEFNAINCELKELGFELKQVGDFEEITGKISRARIVRDKAEAERDLAFITLKKATTNENAEQEFDVLHEAHTLKNQALLSAEHTLSRLVRRQNKLAMWDGEGHLIGGRLADVVTSLCNVEEAAINKVIRLARFYFEINREVTDYNDVERCYALNRILDRNDCLL